MVQLPNPVIGLAIAALGAELIPILTKVAPELADQVNNAINLGDELNRQFSKEVAKQLVLGPLDISGVNEEDTADARKTLGDVTAHVMELKAFSAVLSAVSKVSLGHRGISEAADIISNITDALGFDFFLGGVLHDLTMAAIVPSLEEAINIKHRPARIDFRMLRLMLKKQVMSDAEFRDWMVKLGYPDALIDKLKIVNEPSLSVGEIASALGKGIISTAEATQLLAGMDYSPSEIDILLRAAAHTNNTSAGNAYRSAAITAFEKGTISIDQLRGILKGLGLSDQDIGLEVAAAQLKAHQDHVHLTIGELKQAYLHGDLSRENATQRLQDMGYASGDINLIISDWEKGAKTSNKGPSEQRILMYLVSGVLTKDQAYNMLIAGGMRPEDAHLLVEHPEAHGSVFAYPLEPKIVAAALKEQVIGVDQAKQLLDQLHMAPDEANLTIEVAVSQQTRNKKAKQASKVLSASEIIQAYEYGLMSETGAHKELTTAGYSDQDATILIAIAFTKANGQVPNGWTVLN